MLRIYLNKRERKHISPLNFIHLLLCENYFYSQSLEKKKNRFQTRYFIRFSNLISSSVGFLIRREHYTILTTKFTRCKIKIITVF